MVGASKWTTDERASPPPDDGAERVNTVSVELHSDDGNDTITGVDLDATWSEFLEEVMEQQGAQRVDLSALLKTKVCDADGTSWESDVPAAQFGSKTLADLGVTANRLIGLWTAADEKKRAERHGERKSEFATAAHDSGKYADAGDIGTLGSGHQGLCARASQHSTRKWCPVCHTKARRKRKYVLDFRGSAGLPPGVALVDPAAGGAAAEPAFEAQKDKSQALVLTEGQYLELDLDPEGITARGEEADNDDDEWGGGGNWGVAPTADELEEAKQKKLTLKYTVTLDIKLEELPGATVKSSNGLALFTPNEQELEAGCQIDRYGGVGL